VTSIIVHATIMCGFVVLQTLVFPSGIIGGATPDIALVLLCFAANYHGSYRAEIGGFVSGLVMDSLSLAPFGFHSLIRAIIGYLFGVTRGKLFLDPVFAPVIMVAVATTLQSLIAYLIASVFAPDVAGTVFSARFGLELAMNSFVAPFVFALLKATGMIRPGREQVGYE
jgi:rod shape-determining protein MreD